MIDTASPLSKGNAIWYLKGCRRIKINDMERKLRDFLFKGTVGSNKLETYCKTMY